MVYNVLRKTAGTERSLVGRGKDMNVFKEAIKTGLEEYLEVLRKEVDGLTPAQARWQPTLRTNHIAWIAWHMARVEDYWMNSFLGGNAEVWVADGWADRFGMDPESRGAGQTIEEVRGMADVPLGELMAYFNAVRAGTLQVFERITEDDLARTMAHPKFGSITGAWIMGHILIEQAQHAGQVALIRGMMRP